MSRRLRHSVEARGSASTAGSAGSASTAGSAGRSQAVAGHDDGQVAVVAHALLGATAVVCGTARTLRERGEDLDRELHHSFLEAVDQQGRWMAEVLGLLARGLAAQALELAASPPRMTG